MQQEEKEFLGFLTQSPTAFQAVDNIKGQLLRHGFQELSEAERWSLEPGGSYFVIRNGTSLLAFRIGGEAEDFHFQIAASHSDSPTFKVKENGTLCVRDHYTQLNTEPYGGMLCASWLDRPLSLAGRVIVREGDTYIPRLLNIDRDLLIIPNVAIHFNREANKGFPYNFQVDMLPLLGEKSKPEDFKALLAEELNVDPEAICSTDLYLYNRTQPTILGLRQEYIAAPRLDNLQCAWATLQGFLMGSNSRTIQVYATFDNEEVGSLTRQGAASTFLPDVLTRIGGALGRDGEDIRRAMASSFMVSADNAHALHPNHPEKSDEKNCVYMNEGIVIKSNAQQKYTSDGMSASIWKAICDRAGVPVQYFANRSDMAGGSTLGNLAMAQVSMNCVDVGLAQLAMHSCYETAGVRDTDYLVRASRLYYSAVIAQDSSHGLSLDFGD